MAYFPTDDSFDYGNAGADSYGSRLLGYLGWEPKSTVDAGSLVRNVTVGAGRAFAIGEQSIATNGAVPVAFMRRQAFAEDVSVRANFKFIAVAGSPTTDDGYELGVFARATGGTLTDDLTEFVRYVDGSAYGALLVRTGGLAYDLKLVRWVGGVETELAAESYTLVEPMLTSTALGMRLDVETNLSGDVELSLKVINFKATQVQPTRPPRGFGGMDGGLGQIFDIKQNWTELVSATDTSGAKLTGGGRCGFVMEREREYGARRIVTAVNNFSAHDPTGAPLWSDNMIRASHAKGQAFASAWGATATSLASDFTNDWFASEQDASQVLRRDTGAENVLQQNQASLGQAIDLVPATTDFIVLDLSDPKYVSNIVDRTLTEFTWAAWANLDANDTGNVFFDDFLNIGNGTSIGMTLGLKPGVGANTYRMFATVSSTASGSGTTYETADITEVGMLSTTVHFAWTISSGSDRVRFYVDGVLQVERAMTENPELRGYSLTRVGWNGISGATSANYLDGRLDELRLYWSELDSDEVAHLADPSAVGVEIDRPKLVHLWSLDDDEFTNGVSFGSDGDYLATTFGVALAVDLSATLFGSAASATGVANAARTRALFATQRRVDSAVSQNRSATFTLTNINQTAGVFVRSSFTDASDFTGYRLDARPDPAGEIRLYRVRSGVDSLIASASATVALSTAYKLGLSVAESGTSTAGDAVLLEAYQDDVQVALVAVEGINVSADANGTVRDSNAARIPSGNFEGFHTHTPGGTDAIDVDDWEQGYLGGLLYALSGENVTFSTEISGVTGDLSTTLDVEPLLPMAREQVAFSEIAEYESGHQVRTARSTATRRQFKLRYNLTSTQRDNFLAFWDSHRGGEIPFLYTPEGEDLGVFQFTGGRFETVRVTPSAWLIEFTITERIDPDPAPPALLAPSGASTPTIWASAQANVFEATPNTPPDSASVKTATALNGDAHRLYDAGIGVTQGPTTATLGRHLNSATSTGGASAQWGLVEFTSTAVINGKRTLEPRVSDEFYLARPNQLPYVQPLWTDATGFTFMAHIVPPTSGYGATEHILYVEDSGANAMMRIGWTDSRFYRTAGATGNLSSSYNFGGTTDAKTVLVRWKPGDNVYIWDAGGASVASATFSGLSMNYGNPASTRIFVSSSTESSSLVKDSGIGTKVFVQDVAIWSRALTDAEVDGIGNYWAAQYASTWTALAP